MRGQNGICQLHYESLKDGSLLDDDDALAEYFGPNLPIETVTGLLRQKNSMKSWKRRLTLEQLQLLKQLTSEGLVILFYSSS